MFSGLNKIISVSLIISIILTPLATYADEIPSPEPTPTITEADSATPTPTQSELSPTPTTFPIEGSVTDNGTEQASVTNTNTTEQESPNQFDGIANSGDDTTITTTTTTENKVTIANNSNANIDSKISETSVTGKNTANNNIAPEGTVSITTGEAETQATVETVVNTNIVGTNFKPVIITGHKNASEPIDLSSIRPCANPSTPLDLPQQLQIENTGNNVHYLTKEETTNNIHISNQNNAQVTNDIDLASISGQNQAIENIGETKIKTGASLTGLNLVTLANTNLVGDCFFFGMINLFDPLYADIILPYEYSFLNGANTSYPLQKVTDTLNTGDSLQQTTNTENNNNISITNNDNATLNTTIWATANSGQNTINDTYALGDSTNITTGPANVFINLVDYANQSFFGSGFIFLRINHFKSWNGQLVGATIPYQTGQDFLLYSTFKAQENTATDSSILVNTGDNVSQTTNTTNNYNLTIENNNTANIENNLQLIADSGNNSAGKFNSSIKTGAAQVTANIFNFVNTNIVGNNWFFAVINIFDDFFGNVAFARPDLIPALSTNQRFPRPGETIELYITAQNTGNYKADKSKTTIIFPANIQPISSSSDIILQGNQAIWNIGTLERGEKKTQKLLALVTGSLPHDTPLTVEATISTDTIENIKNNNRTLLSFLFNNPPPRSQNNSSSGGSSGSGGSSSSNSSGNNTPSAAVYNPLTASVLGTYNNRYCTTTKKCVTKKGKKVCVPVKKCVNKITKKTPPKKNTKKINKVIRKNSVVKKNTLKKKPLFLKFFRSFIFGRGKTT